MCKKFFIISLSVVFILLVFSRCSTSGEKLVSQGMIEYSAAVVDKSSMVANLAPTKMTIKFKDNVCFGEMSTGMGFFRTAFVSDPHSKTLTQMVNLLGKKYWNQLNETDINKDNSDYNFDINETKDTKMIAGLKCKKAIVHHKSGDEPDFEVYYTDELGIENPNFANPFNKIKGVLMEYKFKKFGLEMKFVATSVTKYPVDEKDFQVPAYYKKISKKEMNDLFVGLQ